MWIGKTARLSWGLATLAALSCPVCAEPPVTDAIPHVRYVWLREPNPPFTPGWGLKRIEAYPAGTRPLLSDKEAASTRLWSCKIPESLQNRTPFWIEAGTFQAVTLWEQGTTALEKGPDPVLISLDARKGERWRREIPLRRTLAEQRATYGTPSDTRVYLAPASDGERTLALVPVTGGTLTFIYDGSGALLRRQVLPVLSVSKVRTPQSGLPFVIEFATGNGTQTYLVDTEGRLLTRVVHGEDGTTTELPVLSAFTPVRLSE